MTAMDSDIGYIVVILFGAITLVIEAYRQFSTPLKIHPFYQYPILRGIEIETLCTQSELLRGFLVYASMYLIAYGTILGSSELLGIVLDNKNEENSGISPFFNPIVLSAIIISASSMETFSPLEKRVRALSHRIAGIPRGIYRVISRINKTELKLEKISKKYGTPIADEFSEGVNVEEGGPMLENELSDLNRVLANIDLLSSSTIGNAGDQVFSAYRPSTVQKLVVQQREKNSEFKTNIREFVKKKNCSYEDYENLHREATVHLNDIKALFALHLIRNLEESEVAVNGGTKNATTAVLKEIKQGGDPPQKALLGSFCIMLVCTAILYPLLMAVTNISSSGSPELFSNADLLGAIRNQTILAVLYYGALFLACGSAAIILRETSIEYGKWPKWNFPDVPYDVLVRHSIFPGVVAVLVALCSKAIEYMLAVNHDIEGVLRKFVIINWEFCLMQFLTGAILSIVIFISLDQKLSLKSYKAVSVAALFSLMYLLWTAFVQSLDGFVPNGVSALVWRVREIILMGGPGLIFSLAFIFVLEVSGSSEGLVNRQKK